jgi:hypothetical protein
MSKNKYYAKEMRIEGNKGGDFLNIIDKGNGLIEIEAGSCCVNVYHCVVPAEFLTLLLGYVELKFGNPKKVLKEILCENPEWYKELESKIKGINFWGDEFEYKE